MREVLARHGKKGRETGPFYCATLAQWGAATTPVSQPPLVGDAAAMSVGREALPSTSPSSPMVISVIKR